MFTICWNFLFVAVTLHNRLPYYKANINPESNRIPFNSVTNRSSFFKGPQQLDEIKRMFLSTKMSLLPTTELSSLAPF